MKKSFKTLILLSVLPLAACNATSSMTKYNFFSFGGKVECVFENYVDEKAFADKLTFTCESTNHGVLSDGDTEVGVSNATYSINFMFDADKLVSRLEYSSSYYSTTSYGVEDSKREYVDSTWYVEGEGVYKYTQEGANKFYYLDLAESDIDTFVAGMDPEIAKDEYIKSYLFYSLLETEEIDGIFANYFVNLILQSQEKGALSYLLSTEIDPEDVDVIYEANDEIAHINAKAIVEDEEPAGPFQPWGKFNYEADMVFDKNCLIESSYSCSLEDGKIICPEPGKLYSLIGPNDEFFEYNEAFASTYNTKVTYDASGLELPDTTSAMFVNL